MAEVGAGALEREGEVFGRHGQRRRVRGGDHRLIAGALPHVEVAIARRRAFAERRVFGFAAFFAVRTAPAVAEDGAREVLRKELVGAGAVGFGEKRRADVLGGPGAHPAAGEVLADRRRPFAFAEGGSGAEGERRTAGGGLQGAGGFRARSPHLATVLFDRGDHLPGPGFEPAGGSRRPGGRRGDGHRGKAAGEGG